MNKIEIPTGMELVPYCIFDTQIFRTEETTQLRFFEYTHRGECWTNMYIPCQLPNPQALLIEKICIYGMTTDIAFGVFRLQIGNKLYLKNPAWLHAIRPQWALRPPLMIAPLQIFQAKMTWEIPVRLGKGASGLPKEYQPIQVCLLGQMVRPIC